MAEQKGVRFQNKSAARQSASDYAKEAHEASLALQEFNRLNQKQQYEANLENQQFTQRSVGPQNPNFQNSNNNYATQALQQLHTQSSHQAPPAGPQRHAQQQRPQTSLGQAEVMHARPQSSISHDHDYYQMNSAEVPSCVNSVASNNVPEMDHGWVTSVDIFNEAMNELDLTNL